MPTEEIRATDIFWLTAFFDIHRCLLLDLKLYDNAIIANCYCKVVQNLHTNMKQRQPGKLTDGIIVLHDSVHPHVAHRVQDQLNVMQWEVLIHLAYSVDCHVHHILWSLKKVIKDPTFILVYDVQWLCSSKISLQVGCSDLCESVGCCKMRVVIFFF